jgi:hypothetical protein
MTEPSNPNNEAQALFLNLVMMLSTSAIQQMGKLVNPLTQKSEIDLEGAQLSIDMLSMLKEKTDGNLSADEDRMLTDVLANLQMNYVETAQAASTQKKPEDPTPGDSANQPEINTAPGTEATADESAPSEKNASKKDDKSPKFHKTYGE